MSKVYVNVHHDDEGLYWMRETTERDNPEVLAIAPETWARYQAHMAEDAHWQEIMGHMENSVRIAYERSKK